ncbi:MAG: hypothetical protein Q8R91_07265 [Candidatus Omnitrophota bacterium]|nr:hypothetical protein [Candidatus Omnitrophota bacterium]
MSRRWSAITIGSCAVLIVWAAAGAAAEEQAPPEPERFSIVVQVDFGPADRPPREERLTVDAGTTPKDAVSLLFPIQSGAVCCNTRELAAIDGVRADPAKNRWWSCRVNGSTKLSPFRTELQPQDRVEWVYREQSQ